MPNPELPMSFF